MKAFVLFIVNLSVYFGLNSQQNIKTNRIDLEWSEYQGFMNWHSAKEKCHSIGMRLPKKNEILEAHNTGLTKVWEKDGVAYWLDDIYTEFIAYEFLISNGTFSNNLKNKSRRVRCIR